MRTRAVANAHRPADKPSTEHESQRLAVSVWPRLTPAPILDVGSQPSTLKTPREVISRGFSDRPLAVHALRESSTTPMKVQLQQFGRRERLRLIAALARSLRALLCERLLRLCEPTTEIFEKSNDGMHDRAFERVSPNTHREVDIEVRAELEAGNQDQQRIEEPEGLECVSTTSSVPRATSEI